MDKTGFCLLSPQPGLNSRINTCTTCARPLTGHAHHLKVYLRCGKSASFFSCADTPKQIEAVQYRTVSIINGIFARRPCCTQTTIEVQLQYTNLNRAIIHRAGNGAHPKCTFTAHTNSCAILCCALCSFDGFVSKSRIVSTFVLCASRGRGDRLQRTVKSHKSCIRSYEQSRACRFTPFWVINRS